MKQEDVIFKAIVGSHSYGTNVEGSDIDIKGVFVQSPEDVLINGYREQETVNKDEVYFELKRFIDLCCKGNPTVLELLYSPKDCIQYQHPVWKMLVEHRDKFLSKACKYSFGGYAYSQISKSTGLDKKMNWEKDRVVRKTPLDFCYVIDPDSHFKSLPLQTYLKRENKDQKYYGLAAIDHFRFTYNMFYDHVEEIGMHNNRNPNPWKFKGIVQDINESNDVSTSDIPSYCKRDTVMYFNKDGYQEHCKDYKSYTEWLEKRNVQRYVDIEGHGQKIDGKNMLHCCRLLEVGTEIANGKGIVVRRPNADFLKKIRHGKFDLKHIQQMCESKMKEMDAAYDSEECRLPHSADRGFFMQLLVKMRQKFYKQVTISGSRDSGPM